jgi:hypothetical protein
MEPDTTSSGLPEKTEKRRFLGEWGFLWVGLGILVFLAAGFFLTTTLLFRSAYTEPEGREAKDVLASLYESEMRYHAAHHCFTRDSAALDFSPPRGRYYEWSIVSADCTSFLARAWANLDNDPNLDIWEITNNDVFRPLHVFDDEKDIGYRIDPKSSKRWRPENGQFQPPVSDEQ